jgi:mercuric ion transport protein
VTAPSTPPHLRGWGSPTILIDGVDVAGGSPSEACCRLYPTSKERGAPPLALIEAALLRARQPTPP